MTHQDWTPVVFNKKTSPVLGEVYAKRKTHQKPKLVDDDDDDRPLTHKKVTIDFKNAMQQARQRLGLTQKELGVKCSMTEAQIRSYENGSAIPDNRQVQTIRRVLGMS